MNEKTPEQIAAEADAKAKEDQAAAEKTKSEQAAADAAKAESKAAVEEKKPLRNDGPTLAEYVAQGYPAESYPPAGYAAREQSVVNGVVEDPPLNTVAPVVTIDPSDPESVKQQHEAVDQKMAELNAHNEAGAAKIAEAEQAAVEASAAVPHVPTGKEWNKNTPVIDEFGNKHW